MALQGLAGNRATGQLLARLRHSDELPAARRPRRRAAPCRPGAGAPAADPGRSRSRRCRSATTSAGATRSSSGAVRPSGRELQQRMIRPDGEIGREELAKVRGELQGRGRPAVVPDQDRERPLRRHPRGAAQEQGGSRWRSGTGCATSCSRPRRSTVTIKHRHGRRYLIELDRRAHPDAEPAHDGGRRRPSSPAAACSRTGAARCTSRGSHRAHLQARSTTIKVTNSPDVIALKTGRDRDPGRRRPARACEHKERIEKNKDHPVVRRIAEFLGGGAEMHAMRSS